MDGVVVVVDGLGAAGAASGGRVSPGAGGVRRGSGYRCHRRLICASEKKYRCYRSNREHHHDHETGDEASAFDDRAVGFGGGDGSGSGIGCLVAPDVALG